MRTDIRSLACEPTTRGAEFAAEDNALAVKSIPKAYEPFRDKRDNCIKVVIKP